MDKSFNNIDDLMKHIQKSVEEEIDGFVSFDKLFDNGFLDRNSKFSSFDEFLKANKIVVTTQEELDNLDEFILDEAVRSSSDFSSWKDLYEAAGSEYMVNKLRESGFNIS